MSDNYRDIADALKSCRGFRGNTMTGVGDTDAEGYRVYSYDTMIASVTRHPETGLLVRWITDKHYSATTSRQVNLCRANLPGVDA